MSASGGAAGAGGTPVNGAQTGGNQINTATLPAVAAKTNYITGFEITAAGATAGAAVQALVSGVVGGPLAYSFVAPAGVAVGALPLAVEFIPPLPGAAVNTAITVSLPALGAGNTNASVVAHGYVQ